MFLLRGLILIKHRITISEEDLQVLEHVKKCMESGNTFGTPLHVFMDDMIFRYKRGIMRGRRKVENLAKRENNGKG